MRTLKDDAPPTLDSVSSGLAATAQDVSSTWVIIAAILVILMQVGFLFLEVGFARGKNVGTIVAKILVNFSIAAVVWWAFGFAFAFGSGDTGVGTSGFLLNAGQTLSDSWVGGAYGFGGGEAHTIVEGSAFTYFLFQFAFAAVSLAIVWGSTLERIKFIAYPIYAVVFVGIIYPLVAHQVWAGALHPFGLFVQDFAGSSVVHLTGATGALAAVLLLGPRRGKYGPDGNRARSRVTTCRCSASPS